MAITRPRSLDPTQSFSANALTANTITATTFAGSGASITINGTAIALGGSGSITAGATITDDTTTATTHYPVLTISTSGAMLVANTSSSKLTYIPSTGVLSATSFTGAGTGLTGTASININGTVGATTANTGAFTNLAYTGTLTGSTGILNIGSGQVYKDASGNVGIGTSSPSARLSVAGNVGATIGYLCHAGAGAGNTFGNIFNFFWSGSSLQAWIDSTNVGTVTLVSDYRIKKDIVTQDTPAIARINQLRPVTYERTDYKNLYKADGVAREGFIAHELQAIIPSAVEGEKDCENQIQSLNLDALCSVMVKAIQEQQTLIEALTARLTALEAK